MQTSKLSMLKAHTCIAGSPGTSHSQVLQKSMSGLLTGGAPSLLLRPDLLQSTPLGPQIYAPIRIQLQPLQPIAEC